MTEEPFDYRSATEFQIARRADALIGMRIGEIASYSAGGAVSSSKTKGSVGAAYEAYFGIPPNNIQGPDFPSAGVELKSVPIVARHDIPAVKERTFITMIDYFALAKEEWASASIHHKLARVLLIFYEWRPAVEMASFITRYILLWAPSATDLGFMREDWLAVRDKVLRGQAHLISEADGRLLGAATKAADSLVVTAQPFSQIPAKRRAWALKPTLTRSILADILSPRPLEVAFQGPRADEGSSAFEQHTLDRLRRYVSQPLRAVMSELGIGALAGKAKGAVIVRRALGLQDHSRVLEFERLGLEVKTVRMSPAGMPYEAMSFPAFRYRELVSEEWADSELLSRLNRLLVVPLVGAVKATPFEECVLGRPFFWSPSATQLMGIEREWQMFHDEIASGQALSLTPASKTRYVHVRPKGRDGTDTDLAPGVGPVVKKCFWLNKDFVRSIVEASGAT